MDIQKVMYGVFLLSLASGLAFAADTSTIEAGLCELYNMVNQLLAIVVFVLIVVAAIIYAAGQVMGAETRARASVWATSMIIGAVIGIVIYLLVPMILGTMLPASMSGGDITSICGSTGDGGGGVRI